jgi:sugar lactone lactonase YvrE
VNNALAHTLSFRIICVITHFAKRGVSQIVLDHDRRLYAILCEILGHIVIHRDNPTKMKNCVYNEVKFFVFVLSVDNSQTIIPIEQGVTRLVQGATMHYTVRYHEA